MFRSASLTILIGLALAATSDAACTDTLYVSRLRQFSLSAHDMASAKWDSVDVPVTQLADAHSLPTLPILDTSEIVVPTQFKSNCGSDSMDEVSLLNLREITYTQRENLMTRSANTVSTANLKVQSFPNVSFSGTTLKRYWEIDDSRYTTGLMLGQSPVSYYVQFRIFRYIGGNGGYSVTGFAPYNRPLRSMAFGEIDSYVEGLQAAFDSAGHGLDSVRVVSRITEATYSYDPTNWSMTTSIGSRSLRKPAFSGYRTASGYLFVLPHPVALTIMTPEGKVVRNLPASSSPTWDVKDASGHRIARGMYLVRGLGLGVIHILAP